MYKIEVDMAEREMALLEERTCCGVSYGIQENTLRYSPARCINCGMCLVVCPHAVFGQADRAVELVNPISCIECGACQMNCPTGAITVKSGVGCAAAIIGAALRGSSEATCGGDDGGCSC